jgi:hypothetical protein
MRPLGARSEGFFTRFASPSRLLASFGALRLLGGIVMGLALAQCARAMPNTLRRRSTYFESDPPLDEEDKRRHGL